MSPPVPLADPRPVSGAAQQAVPFLVVITLLILSGLVVTGVLAPLPAGVAGAMVLAAAACWSWLRSFGIGEVAIAAPPVLGRSTRPPLAGFVEALPLPAVLLDGEALVVAANAGATGLVPALRVGEPALLVLRLPAIVEAVRKALAGGGPQTAQIFERVPIDRWYEAYARPVTSGGDGRLLLLTFHDLTPLRRAEQTRADFVANASHELRTPLAALSGFIDTLQGPARNDTAAREQFLAIMKEQAQRMARLIDDLLSLSRIELNEHIPPQQPVDLVTVVRQVADGLQLLAREREVDVALTLPDELVVVGDRDELIRVVENLLENALKYGGSGKRVEVGLGCAQPGSGEVREAELSVRDHGPGIAAEHLPRLTERFYRVDVTHSRAEGGTGLGLALVKHTVTRHRGRLVIESEVGSGTTFTVFLPLLRPKAV